MSEKKEKSGIENGIRQNFFRLIKLQFFQNRFLYLGMLLLEFGCMVFGIVVDLRNRMNLGGGIQRGDISGMMEFGMMFVVLILCFGSYNAADNKQISMYPGTKKTRYFSRILLDILFLFCFTVWLVVLYLASCGIYQIIHQILPDVNLLYFFSWSYLLQGCTCFFALSVMAYGLVQLVYMVMQCLGGTGYVMIWIVLLFVCVSLARTRLTVKVYHFLTAPMSWQETFGIYLLIGVISIIISSSIILWKKRPLRTVHGSVLLLLVTVTAVVSELSLKMVIASKHDDLWGYYERIEELKELKNDKRIFKEFTIFWGEENRKKFLEDLDGISLIHWGKDDHENILFPSTKIISVSDAKHKNLESFDEISVTKSQFVLRLEALDGTYNGKPIYQEVMDHIVLTKKDDQLYYDCNDLYYVINPMFGSVHQFTDNKEHNLWDWEKRSGISNGLYLTIIVDDETMKECIIDQDEGNSD